MLTPLADREIGWIGWYFIGIQLFLAWASFRSRGRVAAMTALPSRARHFATTILMQGLYLSLTVLVARIYRVDLFPRDLPTPLEVAAGFVTAGLLAAGMLPLWRRAVASRSRRLHFFMPTGVKEKALWSGVSLAAGIGEEATYRGLLTILLATLTGSAWGGVLLSALIFALGHAFQSRLSMAIIFGFALVFQGLAAWTGALYVSMIAHVVYDLIAGFTYSRLGREMGYVPAEAEWLPTAASPRAAPSAPAPPSPAGDPGSGA